MGGSALGGPKSFNVIQSAPKKLTGGLRSYRSGLSNDQIDESTKESGRVHPPCLGSKETVRKLEIDLLESKQSLISVSRRGLFRCSLTDKEVDMLNKLLAFNALSVRHQQRLQTDGSKFGILGMFMFSRACERCSTPTRNMQDGRALCEHCSVQSSAHQESAQGHVLLCPMDGSEMEKTVEHRIQVDRCPSCGGVFLDGKARFAPTVVKELI